MIDFFFEEADDEIEGGHAFRVMDAYVNWFKSSHKNRPFMTVLRLSGLFDRPAEAGSLTALLKMARHIPGRVPAPTSARLAGSSSAARK